MCSSTASKPSLGCIGRTSEMDLQLQKAEHLCHSIIKINRVSFISFMWMAMGTKHMGIYSMHDFSSEITSNFVVKDSQRHQTTMQVTRDNVI